MKVCNKCGESKPHEQFSKSAGSKDGLQYSCKDCNKEYRIKNSGVIASYAKDYYRENKDVITAYKKEYQEKNREAISAREKEHYKNNKGAYLKTQYNITIEQYNQMFEDQGGVCAICKGINDNGRALSVDHDHKCCPGGKSCGSCIRQLLCLYCNTFIGYAKDDVRRLLAGVAYLEKHAANNGAMKSDIRMFKG